MMTINYKCFCMSEEVELTIRERSPREDVIAWMDGVVRPALGADHQKRSPLCMAPAVEYLKVPMSEDTPVGNVRKH